MSLLAYTSEFQVTLSSNVRGSAAARNRKLDFETELARCLELPGDWKVAVVDIFDPLNWCNVYTDLPFKLVWPSSAQHEQTHFQPLKSEALAAYLTPSIAPVGSVLLNSLTEPERRALQEADGDPNAMHPVNVHWALLRKGEYDSQAQLCAELE